MSTATVEGGIVPTLRDRAATALAERKEVEREQREKQEAEDRERERANIERHLAGAASAMFQVLGVELQRPFVDVYADTRDADEPGFGVATINVDNVLLGVDYRAGNCAGAVKVGARYYLLYALATCTKDGCKHPNAPVARQINSLADLGDALEAFARRKVEHPETDGDCTCPDWGF